jgi:carboxyl-terminal processing protease
VTVVKVFKDAPADIAGMLPGDIITAVEGMDISGMDLSLVVSDHIKGEEGTEVSLTVYRESIDDYVDLTMTRQIVQNPTVEYEMLEEKIGYVALSSFEDVSTSQFIGAVDALEEQGMQGLIVDLRNNGGGVVSVAEGIADYLTPDGKDIVSFKGKGVEDSTYVAKDGHQMDVPMVVLVNRESASASEVLTGALKDHELATVVGTKTFGKGIAQGIFPLPDGSALKLTTAYYYVPSGECIHKEGIEPDVYVELDEDLQTLVEIPKEDDNQIRAAIDVLLEGEEAVKEKLEAEAKVKEQETAAAD